MFAAGRCTEGMYMPFCEPLIVLNNERGSALLSAHVLSEEAQYVPLISLYCLSRLERDNTLQFSGLWTLLTECCHSHLFSDTNLASKLHAATTWERE